MVMKQILTKAEYKNITGQTKPYFTFDGGSGLQLQTTLSSLRKTIICVKISS